MKHVTKIVFFQLSLIVLLGMMPGSTSDTAYNNLLKLRDSLLSINGVSVVDANQVEGVITGRKFYLDPAHGSDQNGNGSAAKPWRSVSKALAAGKAGDAVYLNSGNYGSFRDTASSRNGYLSFVAVRGAKPVFSSIEIRYRKAETDSYLAFYGVTVRPDSVTQVKDPFFKESEQKTYNKTADGIDVKNARFVRIVGCQVEGYNKYLTDAGIRLNNASDILVARTEIFRVHRGTTYFKSQRIVYYYNHVHEIAGTAFHSGAGDNNFIVIEGNHAHDSNYDYSDKFCPRKKGANYHGSAVSLRCSNMLIRNNVFHDGFNSSGMMTYSDSCPRFDNIYIENNLIYDIRNEFVMRFYNAGKNIAVRNNLFAGRERKGKDRNSRYSTSLIIHSFAPGCNGTDVLIANNIFIGALDLGSWWKTVSEMNNIMLSARSAKNHWLSKDELSTTSLVAVWMKNSDSFFSDGFFSDAVYFSWTKSVDVDRGHGKLLAFYPGKNSPSLAFGNSKAATADSLGRIVNGFVQPDGKPRRNDVGPYQQ